MTNRTTENKRRWSLLDIPTIEGMIDALEYGAKKHGKDDWRSGVPYTVLYDKIQRHLAEAMKRNEIDESGLHHTYHALCDLMFLAAMMRDRPDMDDRL